ncbi:MAG: rhomboid family intramembrane serine protease [Candidatus Latescibacterota bacterium]
MDHERGEQWVCVWPCCDFPLCQEYALVLAALDIDHRLAREGNGYGLWVPPTQASRARSELETYQAEMRDWPPPEVELPAVSGDLPHALPCWLVLVMVDAMARHRLLGLDWFRAGRAHAGLIVRGEWWRACTALTLHADGPHLVNNLVFGTLFGLLLSHQVGPGLAWLAIVGAGALGNMANAWLQQAEHTSIGASTGVFGAVGLLVALQWRRYGRLDWRRLRRWAPLVIGAVLLGYLGTGGERTDVLAHLTGAAAGLLLGALLSLRPGPQRPSAPWQWGLGLSAALALGLAWVRALGG